MIPKDICFHQTLKDVTTFFGDTENLQKEYSAKGGSLSPNSVHLLTAHREAYLLAAEIHDKAEAKMQQLITNWEKEAALDAQACTLFGRHALVEDDLKIQAGKFTRAEEVLRESWEEVIDTDWTLSPIINQSHCQPLLLQADLTRNPLSLNGSTRR